MNATPESASTNASVVRFDADHARASLFETLSRLQSPLILWTSGGTQVDDETVARLANRFEDAETSAVVSPQSAALTALFGETSPVPTVAPWCCLLDRHALLEAGLGQRDYQTVEFDLLAATVTLQSRGMNVQTTPLAQPIINFAAWAASRFTAYAAALAQDFQRFKQHFGSQAMNLTPPQYRVEAVGRPCRPFTRPADPANGPKFSLLCPVFKPDHLADMLSSVLAQTWPHWELLMLVDGPPPHQAARIQAILAAHARDPRISFQFQTNQGTGPTRQRLADQATGDFLITIDDDDGFTPDALAVFAAAAAAHPEAKILRGGARLIGLFNQDLAPQSRYLIDDIINDPFEVTQPYAVSRHTFQQLGGYLWDGFLDNAGEDTLFFQKMDRARLETVLIEKTLYHRRLTFKNQSLGFQGDQISAHFHNVMRRSTPSGWDLVSRQFNEGRRFIHLQSQFKDQAGREVVTATQFVQYRTFGDLNRVTIDLEVTTRCNAVCSFCPRDDLPNTRQMIQMNVVDALATQIERLDLTPNVVLCGIGEAVMHPQLDQIVRRLHNAGARLSMTSNGAALDEPLFRRLVEHGVTAFNISLNAATAQTHAAVMKLKGFERICGRVHQLLAVAAAEYPQIAVHVSAVVCQQNLHEIDQFIADWVDQAVTSVWLHPVNNRAGLMQERVSPEDMTRIANQYRGHNKVVVDLFSHHSEDGGVCKIARHLNFISADGELRLCAMDYRRRTAYGNLTTTGLDKMYFRKIRAWLDGETHALCHGCDFRPQSHQEDNVTSPTPPIAAQHLETPSTPPQPAAVNPKTINPEDTQRVLILAANGAEPFLSMGGFLCNHRQILNGVLAVCFSQTTPPALSRPGLSPFQTEALRLDEVNACAARFGLSTRFSGFPEYAVRRGKRSAAHIRAAEDALLNILRRHIAQMIAELQPHLVFAPAALAEDPDQILLYRVVQDLAHQGLGSCGYRLYEDYPACCTPTQLDDLKSRTQRDNLRLIPTFEDVSAVLEARASLAAAHPTRFADLEQPRHLAKAQRTAQDQGSDGAMERFWAFNAAPV